MKETIKLPSYLYVGYRTISSYPEHKEVLDKTVFSVPVEMGSKRYDTVKKWSNEQYYGSIKDKGVQEIIPCKPSTGYSFSGWVSRGSDSKVRLCIPNIGTVEISMENYMSIVDERDGSGKKFVDTEMVYDGNQLIVTEGKTIEYSGVEYGTVVEKAKKREEKRKEKLADYNGIYEVDRYASGKREDNIKLNSDIAKTHYERIDIVIVDKDKTFENGIVARFGNSEGILIKMENSDKELRTVFLSKTGKGGFIVGSKINVIIDSVIEKPIHFEQELGGTGGNHIKKYDWVEKHFTLKTVSESERDEIFQKSKKNVKDTYAKDGNNSRYDICELKRLFDYVESKK